MKKYILSLCLILLAAIPGRADDVRLRPETWATPVLSTHLDNWYKVDDRLYRSEQPDDEAMRDIEKFGIRRVLNLREYHSDDDEVKGTGLHTYHLKLNAGSIDDDDVIRALKIITASPEPILVHCWHGADRTGTIVAMYRIVEQGWTREAALDELVNGGYGYHSIYGNIRDYIEQVDVDAIRRAVHAPFPSK